MRLWVDDIRPPWEHGRIGWTWAKTAAQAIALFESGRVEIASLDHDLSFSHYPSESGGELPARGEGTGYDIVCWLEQHPEFWPGHGVYVHSMNPAGRERMATVIKAHYGERFDCIRIAML